MSDIVERLRSASSNLGRAWQLEAADEIERLRRRVESFEADREFHQAQAAKIRRLEDQCRDIHAATIEECARVAETTWDPDAPIAAIAAAIRALKEQP